MDELVGTGVALPDDYSEPFAPDTETLAGDVVNVPDRGSEIRATLGDEVWFVNFPPREGDGDAYQPVLEAKIAVLDRDETAALLITHAAEGHKPYTFSRPGCKRNEAARDNLGPWKWNEPKYGPDGKVVKAGHWTGPNAPYVGTWHLK